MGQWGRDRTASATTTTESYWRAHFPVTFWSNTHQDTLVWLQKRCGPVCPRPPWKVVWRQFTSLLNSKCEQGHCVQKPVQKTGFHSKIYKYPFCEQLSMCKKMKTENESFKSRVGWVNANFDNFDGSINIDCYPVKNNNNLFSAIHHCHFL